MSSENTFSCVFQLPLKPVDLQFLCNQIILLQNIIYMKARATHPLGYEQKGQENVALGKRTVVIFIEVLHRQ